MLRLPTGNQTVTSAGGGIDRKKQTSCAGYVTKRGHFRKSWKVRYLVLNGADLLVSYYDSKTTFEKNEKSTMKGSFYLSSIEKHEYWIGTVGTKEKPFGFKMVGHAPGKGYVELDIVVDTLHDLNEWLMVAHNALEASKKVTRAGISESIGMTNVMGFKKPVSAQQQVKNLKTSKDESIHGALRDVVEAQALARGGLTDLHIQKEQLDHVEEDLDYVEGDLDYGEKLLNRMKNPLRYILGGSPTRAKQTKAKHHGDAATVKPGQHAGTAAAAGHGQQAKAHGARTADLTTSPEPPSEIEMLLAALGELEEQATAINTEAVRSTEQISRIGDKITHVNDRVTTQTKSMHATALKGNTI